MCSLPSCFFFFGLGLGLRMELIERFGRVGFCYDHMNNHLRIVDQPVDERVSHYLPV